MSKVAVVLLTWQRVNALKNTLRLLSNQTYSDFDVYISNGNPKYNDFVEKVAGGFDGKLDIWVRHDGNEHYAFRRLFVGRDLANQKYKTILFLDDDVSFSNTYVENVLSQWEPKTYKSGFAWRLFGGNYYKERERVWSNEHPVKYCGTGVSMVDAKLFLEKDLVDNYPPGAIKIEDLWMSFYVDHKLRRKGWKLKYMDTSDAVIGGADRVALFKQVSSDTYNKADFLNDLVDMGWKL